MNDKIEKLPKWAQEYIKDLQRQRDVAVRALDKYVDEQPPSPFYTEDLHCTEPVGGPTRRKRYIQAHGMTVQHEGVCLNILLRPEHIDLQWGTDKNLSREVAFIPSSWMAARLVCRERMR